MGTATSARAQKQQPRPLSADEKKLDPPPRSSSVSVSQSPQIQEILVRIDRIKDRLQREHIQRLSNAQAYILQSEEQLQTVPPKQAQALNSDFYKTVMPILDQYEQQLDEMEETAKDLTMTR